MSVTISKTEMAAQLADLNALLVHFHDGVEEQLKASRKRGILPSIELMSRLRDMLATHQARMKCHCDEHAGGLQKRPKEAFGKLLEAIDGLYESNRSYPESRAVRDNLTVLNLYAASLTTLKTYGLEIGMKEVSKMAYEMLEEVCPFIVEMSQKMPAIVSKEIAQVQGTDYDPDVSRRVQNALKRCWEGN